ncbi:MAG: hypothetical protein U0Q18_35970 [Bryobacteraceae bacterium]
MRYQFGMLLFFCGMSLAQKQYTGVPITQSGSTTYFANIYGLNNQGVVLGDACSNGSCFGPNRFPATWSNGVFTPLPIPPGYSYVAVPGTYGINDAGMVMGTLQVSGQNTDHVVVWVNGIAKVVPDAPIAGACSGTGCTCSTSGSSAAYGINAGGHIIGSSTYPSYTPGGPACSGYWVYSRGSFRILPSPVPPVCQQLPPGYYPGVGFGWPAFNDADVAVQTVTNFFCGPPYIPPPGFPAADPALIQADGTYSFLSLGSLAAASSTAINNVGVALGYYSSPTGLIVWDKNGTHDLGSSGYGYLNNASQAVYLGPSTVSGSSWESGSFYIWQNGTASPVQVTPAIFPPSDFPVPAHINDAAQFIAGDGLSSYLLSPSGSCASDITQSVSVSLGPLQYYQAAGRFIQSITVTNNSATTITGPISILFNNLQAGASVFGIRGTTLCEQPQGSPYVNLSVRTLSPGASASYTAQFINGSRLLTYQVRVVAGVGNR